MNVLAKSASLLLLFFGFSLISCRDSSEDKYIELLEQRLEEFSATDQTVAFSEYTEAQVKNEVFDLISFLCPTTSRNLNVRSKRLSSNKWLINFSYQIQKLDEFGFPMQYSHSEILLIKNGELEVDPILKLDLPCD